MNGDERERLKQIRKRHELRSTFDQKDEDIESLLSLLDSQAVELAEEKRLRAELKQIAQIGIQEVSSVGTRLQECAVRDTAERVSLAMRDKCVEKLRDYRLKCERTGVELSDKEDEGSQRMYWRADGAADALEIVERELQSLTLDQVQEKQ